MQITHAVGEYRIVGGCGCRQIRVEALGRAPEIETVLETVTAHVAATGHIAEVKIEVHPAREGGR